MFDEKYTSNNNKHSEMKIQKKYETKIQEKKIANSMETFPTLRLKWQEMIRAAGKRW